MKKILFSLMALMCAMSMNAQKVQVIKVLKNGQEVTRFTPEEADEVVFAEEHAPTTGTAKAMINGVEVDINWVQLWENGPKFAEFNVGAENNKPEDCGGYYAWGSSISKNNPADPNTGTEPLTGSDDTATNLWGSKWRMPTSQEFQQISSHCNISQEIVNGVYGFRISGQPSLNWVDFTFDYTYANNSIFLPIAEYTYNGTYDVMDPDMHNGYYWTSTPGDDSSEANRLELVYEYRYFAVSPYWREGRGHNVRAVLAE